MRIVVLKNGPLDGQSHILEEGNEFCLLIKNKQYIYKETNKKDIMNRVIFKLKKEKDA